MMPVVPRLSAGQASYVLARLVNDRRVTPAAINRYIVELQAEIREIEARLRRWRGDDSAASAAERAVPTDRFRAGKRLWNPEDDALLRERYPHEATPAVAKDLRRTVSSVYGRVAKLGLEKTEQYLASLAASSLLAQAGAKHRFSKGHIPANKGLRRPGWSPGRMRETQFKKGQAPLNYMPVGSTRLVDGYVYRKVTVTPNVPWTKNWVLEHRRVWEKANGPLPPGHTIAFKNGDQQDIRLANLECITRRELMSRNTIHNLPKELASTIQLLGVLTRQINKKERAQ